MKRLTQCQMILQFMQEHGSIDPLQALGGFGCFSLAQRIHDLKKCGHSIVTERVSKQGMFGKVVNFAKYHLEGKGGAND